MPRGSSDLQKVKRARFSSEIWVRRRKERTIDVLTRIIQKKSDPFGLKAHPLRKLRKKKSFRKMED